jgi:hypothetical protein
MTPFSSQWVGGACSWVYGFRGVQRATARAIAAQQVIHDADDGWWRYILLMRAATCIVHNSLQ